MATEPSAAVPDASYSSDAGVVNSTHNRPILAEVDDAVVEGEHVDHRQGS